MKTLIIDVRHAVAVLTLAFAGAAGAQVPELEARPVDDAVVEVETASTPGADHKMTICHVAGKSGKTVTLEIDVAAWPAHQAHGDSMGECLPSCFTNADCAEGEFCRTDILNPAPPPTWDVDHCGEPGVCEPIPEDCIFLFDPVCGCDGATYSNDCFAHAASVNIQSYGECD